VRPRMELFHKVFGALAIHLRDVMYNEVINNGILRTYLLFINALFFFFFFLNESFIKPNTNYNHTREIWFKLFHGQIESPKRAHSKALKTKTKCRRQSAASYTS